MRKIIVFIALSACAPEGFPDDPVFSDPAGLEMPRIAPMDPIVDAAGQPNATEGAEAELQARGGALRSRADALRAQPR